jgi:hypothetical protein
METCNCHLTKEQRKKLMKGKNIQMNEEQIHGGPHKLYLRKEQHKNLKNARKHKKGFRLEFDSDQIEHHKGTGLFDGLKDIGKNIGKNITSNFINKGADYLKEKTGNNPIVNSIIDNGKDIIREKAYNKIEHAGGTLRSIHSNNKLMVGGSGLRMHGSGVFSEIGNFINKLGNTKSERDKKMNPVRTFLADNAGKLGELADARFGLGFEKKYKNGGALNAAGY